MKRLFAILLVLALAIPCGFAETTQAQAGFGYDFMNSASADTGAMIRYWLPGAPVDLDQMRDEIRAMAEVGIAGIELACVCDGGDTLDPANRWDTENWYAAMVAVLETAKEVGITVDLTVGPHWPLMIPGIDVDNEAAQQLLKTGFVAIEPGATYEGQAPACDSALADGAVVDTLQAVTVAKVVSIVNNDEGVASASGGFGAAEVADTLYTLDASTLQVVEVAEDGTINWTAPEADAEYNADDQASAGKWAVVSYWLRGAGQKAGGANGVQYTNEVCYVVDHFSLAGTQAFIDYWNENLLTEEVLALLDEVGGSFFEDSLEVSGTRIWTPEFIEYFNEHMGYDITPYLPTLYGMVDDEVLTARVMQDYEQVLNDMYVEYHILPIQEFVNTLGMTFRSQSYGGTVDSSETAQLVDIIEGELLTFSSMGISIAGDTTPGEWIVDNKFRVLRGGANMGGKTIVSDEIGSLMNGDWVLGLDRLLEFMNNDFSAGVNNMVMHGYPYKYFSNASWPTGATFSPCFASMGFGSVLSAALPNWATMSEFMEYVNRMQYILRSGQSDVDVVIYRDETSTGATLIADGTLVEAGFSYDYISPANLADSNPYAVVTDGVLAAETASYKAMLVYAAESMTIAGAKKIQEYAQAGLPVVFASVLPTTTRGYAESAQDEELQAIIEETLALENVMYVEAEADVSETLVAAGITPDTNFAVEEPHLATIHRHLDNADYYYLFNRGYDHDIDVEVSFVGTGAAYALNSYNGEVTVVANAVQNDNGTVTIPVQLEMRDATVIVISDDEYYAQGAVEANEVGEVSAEIEISEWTLALESWWPANEDVSSAEVVTDLSDLSRFDTAKETVEIALNGVQAWTAIEGYETVCGIGTYTTQVAIAEVQIGKVAILDVGKVDNMFELYVNGVQVKANLITEKADITDYLVAGDNEITIIVPSEMINALTVVREEIFGPRAHTVNGLQENPVLTIY